MSIHHFTGGEAEAQRAAVRTAKRFAQRFDVRYHVRRSGDRYAIGSELMLPHQFFEGREGIHVATVDVSGDVTWH